MYVYQPKIIMNIPNHIQPFNTKTLADLTMDVIYVWYTQTLVYMDGISRHKYTLNVYPN